MYEAELKAVGYTDEKLSDEASRLFNKTIAIEGGDDALTRTRRSIWYREVCQRTMGAVCYDVRGEVGATVRHTPGEPAPYPAENDIAAALAWMDAAMDRGTYVSERDDVALHMLNADHREAFENAVAEHLDQRRAAGKPVPE